MSAPVSSYSSVRSVRLTRRGRIVLVAMAASVALVGLWGTAPEGAGAAPAGVRRVAQTSSGESVTVGRGDTLWVIATRTRPGADPRITVSQIMDVNGLTDPIVQPGQRLWLPVR